MYTFCAKPVVAVMGSGMMAWPMRGDHAAFMVVFSPVLLCSHTPTASGDSSM